MKMINDIQLLKKKLAKANFELGLSNRRLTTDQRSVRRRTRWITYWNRERNTIQTHVTALVYWWLVPPFRFESLRTTTQAIMQSHQIFTKHIASITSEYCGTTEVNLALEYVDEMIQSNWFSNN